VANDTRYEDGRQPAIVGGGGAPLCNMGAFGRPALLSDRLAQWTPSNEETSGIPPDDEL